MGRETDTAAPAGDAGGETGTPSPSGRCAVGLFLLSLIVYACFSYGGIRAPDNEVTYRVARALALKGSFAVERYLDEYPNFGYARGRDGRLYSRYQPLHPLLLAPFVRIAEPLSRCQWVQDLVSPVPGSHYVTADRSVMLGATPSVPQPHAARFLASSFTVLVSALNVVLFYLLALQLVRTAPAAWLSAAAFGFCTLNVTYAGTLFKEPLINTCLMASLYALLAAGRDGVSTRRSLGLTATSGLLVGLAVATHVLSVLFVPLYGLLAAYTGYRRQATVRQVCVHGLVWAAALVPVAVALAWHNDSRFGSILDTGFRAAASEMTEQRFQNPLLALGNVFFSAGKGLALYCPVAVVGLVLWPLLMKRHAFLGWIALFTVVGRALFIASFLDWHAGFCLGPRYFVNLLPLLLLPLACLFDRLLLSHRTTGVMLALGCLWAAACQQIYFAMGEVFSWMHAVKWGYARNGVDVFQNDFLYTSWRVSPLLHLLNGGNRGPFLLRHVPFGDAALFAVLASVALLATVWVGIRLRAGPGR